MLSFRTFSIMHARERMRLVVITFFLCIVVPGFAQFKNSLVVSHKIKPQIVMIDGQRTLYYELYFNNNTADSICLTAISSNDKSVLTARYLESDLTERFVNRSRKKSGRPWLAPGDSAVVYLETQFNTIPGIVEHSVQFEIARNKSHQSIRGPRVICSTDPAIVLAPPLGKGNWAAVYDPSWLRGHRRVIFNIKGKERIPGRFAIDFILLDNNGRYSDGDEDLVTNWLGYDADVLAVADGIVASVNNSFTESKTLSAHPSYPAGQATGNYISIDIGNGKFAFYEHLRPGSINVTPGQKVKKGEVIATLGFTGQSTGPHLHFHVADGNSPLGAEGVPFVFEHFQVQGSYPDFSMFGKNKWTPPVADETNVTNERPAPNSVIRF